MSRFEKSDDKSCWVWNGTIKKIGYGCFWFERKHYLAHVFSYEFFKEPVPKGKEIDHLCRNRSCMNPNHLEAVSHRVNCLRGIGATAINAKKTHCPKGHEYTLDNLFLFPDGKKWRRCKICYLLKTPKISKLFCNKGHKLFGNNVRWYNNSRYCITCNKIRSKNYRNKFRGLLT